MRGLTRPYPGAFTFVGGRRVLVWKVRPHPEASPGAGTVDARGEVILVGAGAGAVQLLDASFEDDVPGGLAPLRAALRAAGRFDARAAGSV